MLNFTAGQFAIAGLLAAAGPVLIHLLNRRRFRTQHWAAMDFLREALARNRRILRLRDLLLLLLRIFCVVLFGVALAQPNFTGSAWSGLLQTIGLTLAVMVAAVAGVWGVLSNRGPVKLALSIICGLALLAAVFGLNSLMQPSAEAGGGSGNSRQPVHAVLVVDNSQSMGVETLGGDLLAEAKSRATEFIDALPADSRISVIPLCETETAHSRDAYRTQEDARQALERIPVVDVAGSALEAFDLASEACRQASELPAKRVVFLADLQAGNWPAEGLPEAVARLPELQIAPIVADQASNVWIADFRLQDGIADVETPAVFLLTLRYRGDSPLRDAEVALAIDDAPIASRLIDLEPGQTRQLEFTHQFDVAADPGRPRFVVATAELRVDQPDADRLKRDNQQSLAVPVMAGLPVVFIDQYGASESLAQNRVGETFRLRQLLAPRLSRTSPARQLIRVRHARIEEVDVQMLQDARLVVLAGVERPGPHVRLLREYVQQGGRLVIAAGGRFDPAAWNDDAWLDGAGILPAPLAREAFGVAPEESTGQLQPFYLSFDSMQHDYFLIEQESREALEDLYGQPLFFKAVQVETSRETLDALVAAESARIRDERAALELLSASIENPERNLTAEETAQRRLRELQPAWLLWEPEDDLLVQEPDEAALRSVPRVLATFTAGDLPFLVERRIGAGRVLFVSSGVYSNWNTLTQSNAILMFDRIFRALLEQTVPRRNVEAGRRITLRVDPDEGLTHVLERPLGEREPLSVEALAADAYGVVIRRPTQAGTYTVTTLRDTGSGRLRESEVVFAVNGSERESDLKPLTPAELQERLGSGALLLASGEPIHLEGGRLRSRGIWKLLIVCVLGLLAVEMLLLAWPALRRETA